MDNFYDINNDLLVKFLLKETDAEENRLVQNWLEANSDNRQFFEHFQIVWEESKNLQVHELVNEVDAWERFQKRIHPSGNIRLIKMANQRKRKFMQVAAIFILVIAGGWFTYYMSGTRTAKLLAVNSENVSLKDTLSDGSVVTLNKHSIISYPEKFKGTTRSVNLKGEAFFNIAPDKQKPFIIHVNDLTVKVVGTSFNIRSNGDSTEVIVETGIVEVSRNNQSVSLQPKEKITINKTNQLLEKLPVTDKLYNYYRTKVFQCDATPLWKLVEVLNQAYDSKIVINRKELSSLQISTTFENEPLDHILEIISQSFDHLTVVKSGDSIILK